MDNDAAKAALDELIRQTTTADRVIIVEDENKLIAADEVLRQALQSRAEMVDLLTDLKTYIETGKYDHDLGYPKRIDQCLSNAKKVV